MTAGPDLTTREGNIQDILREMRDVITDIPDGLWSSLAMLVTDSTLTHDEAALHAAHDGLRRFYGWMLRRGFDATHPATVGRVLGHIDATTWGLRRLPR